MPMLGLGLSHNGGFCADAVRAALAAGYALFDTAQRYRTEASLGALLREHLDAPGAPDRSALFVTSKVWPGNYSRVRESCEASCEAVGLGSLDLMLVHWPDCGKGAGNAAARRDLWREMELLVEAGVVRCIGVSNYLREHLEPLVEECSVPPAVLQSEFNPAQNARDVRLFCEEHGIQFQGYWWVSAMHCV